MIHFQFGSTLVLMKSTQLLILIIKGLVRMLDLQTSNEVHNEATVI